MECQSSDSKKLFKVFDASKRKRTRKKNGVDDENSLVTDDSITVCQGNVCRILSSAKASLQDVPTAHTIDVSKESHTVKRDRESSPSVSRSPCEGHRKSHLPRDGHRPSRSPRRHRRPTRDGISLALKAGLVSTPRSVTPLQEADVGLENIPQDQDSFIYAFLEEAIKRDKRKQRHSRRQYDDYRTNGDREASSARRHRHHHRRREDVPPRDPEKSSKMTSAASTVDQVALFETFAKICAQLNEKTKHCSPYVPRSQSHKSLQCEVMSKRDTCHVENRPKKLHSRDPSRENVSKMRSQENIRETLRGNDKVPTNPLLNRNVMQDKCACCSPHDKVSHFPSKLDLNTSADHNVVDDRYHEYPSNTAPIRSCAQQPYRYLPNEHRDYRDYERNPHGSRYYDDDKRKYFEQKTSRSFDIPREVYRDDDKYYRRTTRSEANKEKRYDDQRDKRNDERDKYFDHRYLDRDRFNASNKEKRSRHHTDKFERNSIASRDEDYRDRDRYFERERDSGLSVADGETSTVSGRSNYLRVVKEISEQREAMDKMMKLWKELMRCFKGISSQTQSSDKAVQDSAANVQESAAAQLRLWRECMRRYETVARDVGDTDARLMEEINKQRSEMAEMAGMWQECLQRYREMSTDFNSLKQQLVTPESPTRMPAAPLVCAEGEGMVAPGPYHLPPSYPPMAPMHGGYGNGGSPLRPRASAPPAWWWTGEGARPLPRRRSSPDSRGSRDRDRERRHRHKDRDRDDSRYKEKSSKPNAARSEHRHRKR
ncbi:uncharacterized protein DDB_G0283697-like isoform X2 [Achroia grisella]|uniref:uncharacterized protein DDB_G0283697-like isoform X2 n=1 Tax=Achroia grisella TaxID=688607 RepID=UPI0027D2B9AE|nr:uncharacterized protein DDB_G0283697-like isoform X2 [Achroia grisella]